MIAMAATPEEKLRYAWYDAESAAAFLLNIPTRFDFECRMHEARDKGETLTPKFLKSLMAQAWKDRYGDTLEVMDDMFWATKLHFHMTGVQFYNFPYTFGYLFALGVYAQQVFREIPCSLFSLGAPCVHIYVAHGVACIHMLCAALHVE